MLLPSFTEQAKKKIARHEVIPSFAPNTSIFEQPVHIATPAPSPPPTPVGGGKTLRKINYQTNQQFPMLYPPVNVSGDPFGDSMPSDLPNYDSSKDWDADFVPASILEAGNLFSQRSRLTLASKQLWDEKECYLAYERGLSQETAGVQVSGADTANKTEKPISDNERLERRNAQWRLEFIEDFYHQTFAHMQSFVVVLFKEMQQDVRLLLTPKTSQTSGPGPAIPSADKARRPGPPARTNTSLENMSRPNSLVSEPENGKQQTRQEIAETRSLEISLKAISGIFLTMLRWFKVSHVLKFEYLAQLLFDIDFVSRALIYVSQDLDVTVNGCPDNPQDGFFNYCIHHSGNDPAPDDDDDTSSDSDDSEDPACPPPIKLKRGTTDSDAPVQPWSHTPPEVDELGNPVDPEHPLPLEPVKYFSFRTLFTTINVLQILQKLTKGKTHRNIALVNFKSSHYLARALRIPQPDLRLYTLKLYKGQVPFCGRKWRQGNMRVITAVYLYCWPELRDEWLYGGDVERRVEEALPMEQSLRALTHWYNARRYPERFRLLDADGKGLRKEEQDFFERELESMGLGSMQLEDLQDEGDGGAAPAAPVAPGPRTQAEAQAQRLQQQQQQRQQQQRADGMAGPR